MNFWEILLLFFSFQGFLMSVLFFIKQKGDRISNVLLALFLLTFSYAIFFYVLFWSEFNWAIYLDLYITDEIPFALLGPLFFLYIARTVNNKKITIYDLFHLIPFVLVLYQYVPFYILTREEKASTIANYKVMETINAIPHFPFILSLLILIYGLVAYIRYAKKYKDDSDLKIWLKAISLSYLMFSFSNILYYILAYTSKLKPGHDYFITLAMVLFVGLVSYFGFMYPSIFNGKSIKKVIPFVKYERTGLSRDYSLELKGQLQSLMKNEKPYLDSDIRLDDLAEMLSIPRHHASQVINEHFRSNFFDFVNSYRVKMAESILKEHGANMTIQKIAYQSGFNNRASFYKAFKKVHNITPTEYKDLTLAS